MVHSPKAIRNHDFKTGEWYKITTYKIAKDIHGNDVEVEAVTKKVNKDDLVKQKQTFLKEIAEIDIQLDAINKTKGGTV